MKGADENILFSTISVSSKLPQEYAEINMTDRAKKYLFIMFTNCRYMCQALLLLIRLTDRSGNLTPARLKYPYIPASDMARDSSLLSL